MYGSFADSKVFETLFVLAGIGLLALVLAGCFGIYWLFTHVSFSVA